MRAGRVVFDLQAIQSVDQRHRGIPRYVADLAAAIEASGREPVGTYAVNPDLALPEVSLSERLIEAGKLARSDDVDWSSAGLLHIASPLEMSVPDHRLLPPAARAVGVPWVVTFYDLIPHLMPDYYLEDPGLRRRYRARLQLVRTATAVLTLSEASRADIVEHLGLDPRRVFVVGAGTSERFVPPAWRAGAATAAAGAVPGLRPPFVFYIGSYEKRKNLEPLLEAWSRLPEAVRARWQLALCCPLRPLERNHLLHRAAQLGITESVCLTGFVDDDTLLLLHQGTDLFVFPSLYEGYGLPVAEALACGAPVLAADASSLPEIVGPEALFDPTDPGPIAAAIERGLTDDGLRRRLLSAAGRDPTTWAEVATATMDVYDRVLSGELRPPGGGPSAAPASAGATAGSPATRRADPERITHTYCGLSARGPSSAAENGPIGPGPARGAPVEGGAAGGGPAPPRRWRVAFAAALPPDGAPNAQWNFDLLQALTGRADVEVHAFADRPPGAGRERRPLVAPPGVPVHPLASLEAVESLRGPFDAVVYALADDEHHTGCLAALRRRRDGVVVAHQVALSDLYGHAARSGALADGLDGTIRSAYGDGVHPGVGAHGVLPQREARRLGILLARDVLAHCRRLVVTRPSDATLADLDAALADRAKIHLAGAEPAAVADALY
ncbi:MAG TPA: glycosyltransferase family 1 protein, partial [Acidimicrobiia bacterium]|nr:glycosyltransferase family 1 protein [Acidimicrobiia bacterium]